MKCRIERRVPVKHSRPVKRQRWSFYLSNDWIDIFRGHCNWYNFTLCLFEIEWTKYMHQIRVEFGLLGFSGEITFTYNFSKLDELESLSDEIKAALHAEHPDVKEIRDPFDEFARIDNDE